jgi:putative phage-type endonuclease
MQTGADAPAPASTPAAMAIRAASIQPATFDAQARTVEVVWTTGADVMRAIYKLNAYEDVYLYIARPLREGITATDLPAILGLNKYKTAIDVWTEKVAPSEDNFKPAIGEGEAALWGIMLEDVVANTWAEHAGLKVRRIGIIAHEDHSWQRASLDRLVVGCPDGRCGLEVKTRSGYVGDEWNKGIPDDVKAQVRWQLHVSGLDHIHVIALIGGQRLVEHRVTSDQIKANELLESATIVWDAVQSGQAPQLPEAMWTDAYLEALNPDRSGELEITDETAALATEYNDLLSVLRDLEAEKAEMKTKLIGALGEHEIATRGGRTVYSYKATTTKRLDAKALAELHPDAHGDDRVYNTTTTRTLRTSTKGTKND